MVKHRFVLSLLALTNIAWSSAQAPPITPHPQVDQRVELLSIVFRLAGNPEYNMDSLPAYSADIDRYFAPYKSHAAVQMAQSLRNKKGVSFDAVMSMAISISQPPELKPLVAFTGAVPDQRWGVAATEKFLPLLRDFYRDSKFADFFAAHRATYRTAEARFATTLGSVDFGWYSRFYGKAPDLVYHLVLGMNNGGGNYGPRLIHDDGAMELFSIIGCWTHDDAGDPTYPPDQGYLATIIHEFNHSFVNPAVDARWKTFTGAEPVYASVADKMKLMAYGNAKTMVKESLVRLLRFSRTSAVRGMHVGFESAGSTCTLLLLRECGWRRFRSSHRCWERCACALPNPILESAPPLPRLHLHRRERQRREAMSNAGNHHKINYIEFHSTDIERTKKFYARSSAGALWTTGRTMSASRARASTADSSSASRMTDAGKFAPLVVLYSV
jgi:hypothetical protein